MARLKVPAKPAAQHQTPPPLTLLSSAESADSEAAADQLHRETTASAAKQKQPPSAVLGANLLNAARINNRHSSPIRSSHNVRGSSKSEGGKLRRVTFHTEKPRQNLARGEEVYEIPNESPQKRPSSLPKGVKSGAPKKSRKSTGGGSSREAGVSSDLPDLSYERGDDTEDPQLGLSPPEIVLESEREVTAESSAPRRSRSSLTKPAIANVDIHETNESGEARCSLVSYNAKDRQHTQCQRSAATETDQGMRCDDHTQKMATVRCAAAIHDGTDQCGSVSSKVTAMGPRCARHLKKKTESFVPPSTQPGEPSKEIANSAKVRTTTSTQGRGKRKAGQASLDEQPPTTKKSRGAAEQSTSAPRKPQSTSKSRPTQASSEKAAHASIEGGQKGEEKDAEYEEEEAEDEGMVEEEHDSGTQDRNASLQRDFQRIYDFTESTERSGKCETKTGTSLKRIFDKSTAVLEQEELSAQQVSKHVKDVTEALGRVDRLKQGLRANFKGDAYSYVFLSIAHFVRALHVYHDGKTDTFIESLDAVHHFALLTKEILSFKDLIASWKVKVPQRYQGDKAIRDVDMHFIAPLRKLADIFRRQRHVLHSRQTARLNLEAIHRQIEQEEAEAQRNEVIRLSENHRRKRWQALHVKRMQCEPDIFERRKLIMPLLSDFVERDADGNKFERLELLKKRTTPPSHRPSLLRDKEWTDTQETALIEGLERYAGENVYLKIFPQYCCPGGVLRPFTVTDIVLKGNWIKSSWLKLQQEHGWEVPGWVDSIPSLP